MAEPVAAEPTAKSILDSRRSDELDRMVASVPDAAFRHLRHYVMFVGSGRSGHSVVGAILDAHPHMAVANELNALRIFAHFNYQADVALKVILASLHGVGQAARWNNTGYDYNIAGLSQGRWDRLEVLGDKKAGASSMFALRHASAPQQMLQALGSRLKVILVLRNPYDTISAIAHRQRKSLGREVFSAYFRRMRGALHWKRAVPEIQFLTMRHEDLVADKAGSITRLCGFVGQDAPPEYVQRCASMMYDSPNPRRYSAGWSSELIDEVKRHLQSDEYASSLAEYSF